MMATSPNQDGVEGTDCGEVWILTAEDSILFMIPPFQDRPTGILSLGMRQINLTVAVWGYFRQKSKRIEASQEETLKVCEAVIASREHETVFRQQYPLFRA
jgi:hypothetical protein